MAAAGITEDERNPIKLLQNSGVGMTDLVKRASARADKLTTDEYRSGLDRLDDLCVWLAPRAVCFLGLAGWRAAVEPTATAGWQTRAVGGCPAYVMGNSSGLNAHDTVESLAAHLRRALEGPPEKRNPFGS